MVQTSPWKDSLHAGHPHRMPDAIFGMAAGFFAIAFYLIIEINVTVLRTFKKRRGLYFWSLLISSWGTFFHTLGYVTLWWVPKAPWGLNTSFIMFGWSAMITFQSLVLYSRLHLVIRNHKILRGVLIMIMSTIILIQIPQWVTTWAATDTKLSVTKKWSPYDSIMVRVSQLAFLLQEGTLSILYIWGAVKVLSANDKIDVRRVKWDLIYINTFLILVDVIILCLAYTNEHFPKEPIQNFVYAFKLKIEFVVLNQLMIITSQSRATNFNGGGRYIKPSSWDSPSAQQARSNPSTDGKQYLGLTTSASEPKSPSAQGCEIAKNSEKDRSQSESSDATKVVSPTTSFGKAGNYFAAEMYRELRSQSDSSDATKIVSPSYKKRSRVETDPNCDGKQSEILPERDGAPFRKYHSSERLAPTHAPSGRGGERLQMQSHPPLRKASRNWWGRLLSMIPTGEERLHKDLAAVERGDMKV